MHRSSMVRMQWFIREYLGKFYNDYKVLRVLDVGSYGVNGTYKELFSLDKFSYNGLDMQQGPNVDIVPKDIYSWKEIEDNSFDVVISGQAFEHIEYPWLTISEISRVMRKDGICCIIAPSTTIEHKYPYDCYRYYEDGLRALAKWGKLLVLHASTGGVPSREAGREWDSSNNDTMLIAVKEGNSIFKTIDLNYLPNLPTVRRDPLPGDSIKLLGKYVIRETFFRTRAKVIMGKKSPV